MNKYYLRDDGEITTEWVQGYECIFDPNKPLAHSGERVMTGDALLFFDFAPVNLDFWQQGKHCINGRDASKKLGDGVSRKGLGIIKKLQAKLPTGMVVNGTSLPPNVTPGVSPRPVQPSVLQAGKAISSTLQSNGMPEVSPYLTKSTEQLRQLAGRGDAEARFRLGKCYEYGYSNLPQNPERAKRWYMLAARQGHQKASAKLVR